MAGVSGKFTSFLAKAAGVTGLALVAYDSHSVGKRESSTFEKNYKAKSLANNHMDNLTLDSQSVVKKEIKKQIFKFNLDEDITGFFTTTLGYLKGFGSMCVENIVPFGLAVGAVVGKKLVSKFSALGLLIYGGIFVFQELFGIGKSKR